MSKQTLSATSRPASAGFSHDFANHAKVEWPKQSHSRSCIASVSETEERPLRMSLAQAVTNFG
jgi:hypothetical protein